MRVFDLILLLIISSCIISCDGPSEPIAGLKKPFEFGVKPDSIGDEWKQGTWPDTDVDDSAIITLVRIDAHQKQAYSMARITKIGYIQAIVSGDYSTTGPQPTVSVNLAYKIGIEKGNRDLMASHKYVLTPGKPGIARREAFTPAKNATADPRIDPTILTIDAEVSAPAGLPYPVEIQFVTVQD